MRITLRIFTCIFMIIVKYGSCEKNEMVEIPLPPPVLMKVISTMTEYLRFLDRCPLEPIRMLSTYRTGRPILENDACTINSAKMNTKVPHVYYECVPSKEKFIRMNLAEVLGIYTSIQDAIAKPNSNDTILHSVNTLRDLVTIGPAMIYERGLITDIPIDLPGLSKCGVYEKKMCQNNYMRFNFYTQTCVNGSLLSNSVQFYLAFARQNPLLMMPGFFLPKCVTDRIPDAVQYLIMQLESKFANLKQTIEATLDVRRKSVDMLSLLRRITVDYLQSSKYIQNFYSIDSQQDVDSNKMSWASWLQYYTGGWLQSVSNVCLRMATPAKLLEWLSMEGTKLELHSGKIKDEKLL